MAFALTRIVFWEPVASPHKQAFLNAVARQSPELEIVCCTHEGLPRERAEQGWSMGESAGFREICSPSAEQVRQLIEERVEESLHVFSGIRWVPTIELALAEVRRRGARFAIQSEPRVREGFTGTLRWLHSLLTERWHRTHCSFVLAIGRNGPPWFQSVFYPAEKIFPFAYFVDGDFRQARGEVSVGEPCSVGYLGRLVEMKGVDDLLDAMKSLGRDVRLTIAGAGPDAQRLHERVTAEGIQAEFPGVIPMAKVPEFIRGLDVLVLPSRSTDDGWGVVVSEALLAGVPVIATHCVGASILLDEPLNGRVVSPRSPEKIQQAVLDITRGGLLTQAARAERAAWAASHINAAAGARYFLIIVGYVFGGGPRPRFFYQD